MIYNRRLLFTLKLAQNLAKLEEAELAEAFEQYPEDVVLDVKRAIQLKHRLRRKPADDGQS